MLLETPSQARLLAQRQLVQNLEQQVALREAFGLAFYEPHHKQDLFHSLGDIESRYGRTGNRFGKSLMGCAEDCAFALGYRPWYEREFDVLDGRGNIVRHNDPVTDAWRVHIGIPQRNQKILIISTDWSKVVEVFTNDTKGNERGKIWKLLGKHIVDVETEHGKIVGVKVQSKWGGISSINFDTVESYKRNKMSQESSNFDVIHVDEPIPEPMFVANARGLVDSGGKEFFTCTPITEMWINDYFLPEGNIKDEFPQGNLATVDVKIDSETFVVKRWMITGSMHDNPKLTNAAKAKFISTMRSEEVESRIEGRPRMLSGAIYTEFQRDVHIYREVPKGWKDYDHPPDSYTLRLAIDSHGARPQTVLFAATSPTGHVFFFNEIFAKEYIKTIVAMVHNRLRGRSALRNLIDLSAYNENPLDGIRIADEFNSGGIAVEPATKDLQYGIQRVKQELMRRDERGHPWLNFAPHLSETIREFDRYVWDTDKGKPRDADDHMMECLYRLVLTGLEYVPPDGGSAYERIKPINVNGGLSAPLPVKPSLDTECFTTTKRKHSKVPGDYRVTSSEEREFSTIYSTDLRKILNGRRN